MGHSYNRSRKNRRAANIAEALADKRIIQDDVDQARHIKNQIRNGKLPRFMFVKTENGEPKYRKFRQNLKTEQFIAAPGSIDLTQTCTFAALTDNFNYRIKFGK